MIPRKEGFTMWILFFLFLPLGVLAELLKLTK